MAEEHEFTPEDIQQAANEARQREFGDFMFRDPGMNRGGMGGMGPGMGPRMTSRRTSRQRMTSSRLTTRRHTSENRRTSRRRTSRRPVKDLICTKWRTTARGKNQSQSCWKDGNMWVYKKRRRNY